MSQLTPKQRLLRVLRKEEVDRPPVICTGGMMNAAIVEIMTRTGCTLPEAHTHAGLMEGLAGAIHQHTGFENIGVPFCMTCEAELLGSEVDLGTLECEPKIVREKFPSVRQVEFRDVRAMIKNGRSRTIVGAARRLAAANPDIPVIGSLTGPVSTGASVVDPLTFYKELRRDPEGAHRFLSYVTELLKEFCTALLEDNGATLIAVGDPSATGEILGPAMFEEYALRYLNELADHVHELGAPFILHICGDLKRVRHLITQIRCDALSTDAMINLAALKRDFPHITTMGNVSTFALEWGTNEKLATMARNLVRDGVNIISPACGLSTATCISNIRAVTAAVKESEAKVS
jgi:[methyl-Co(III) methanol-specific corrinoid protein]:coenzyme M methyltransferase